MEYRQSLRQREIAEEVVFIYDDKDYKMCILDAVINEIDTKGVEFTNAIEAICPNQLETQKRYINEF